MVAGIAVVVLPITGLFSMHVGLSNRLMEKLYFGALPPYALNTLNI